MDLLGIDPELLALTGLAVLVASVIQGVVGLGLALIAAPVVVLLEPTLMPGGMLILGAALPSLTLAAEWRHVVWRDAGWATGARLVTTPLGVLVLTWLSPAQIALVVGVGVLVSVVLTAWRLQVRASRRNLAIAGAVAGVSGTAASIGGPPLAVVLQHQQGPRLRATLAAFFMVGSIASLAGLAIGGQLTRAQLTYGISWIPAVAVGFVLAVPLRRHLHGPRLRTAVLVICALSAIVVIVRSAFWS